MMHRILLKIKTVTISINLPVNSYIVAVTTIRKGEIRRAITGEYWANLQGKKSQTSKDEQIARIELHGLTRELLPRLKLKPHCSGPDIQTSVI